jgi:hypothetical protein
MVKPFAIEHQPEISLSPAALPYYALRTTMRMLAALVASLLFTFTYATLAAKSRHAGMVLIPLLETSAAQTRSCGRSAGAAALADAVEADEPAGGGTCAGATVSGSSSSRMPALKALMPLAKSPITRGSLPAPNRIRMIANTTIQCIKLKEPMMSMTPDADHSAF